MESREMIHGIIKLPFGKLQRRIQTKYLFLRPTTGREKGGVE
jgi:hypothetical protein